MDTLFVQHKQNHVICWNLACEIFFVWIILNYSFLSQSFVVNLWHTLSYKPRYRPIGSLNLVPYSTTWTQFRAHYTFSSTDFQHLPIFYIKCLYSHRLLWSCVISIQIHWKSFFSVTNLKVPGLKDTFNFLISHLFTVKRRLLEYNI